MCRGAAPAGEEVRVRPVRHCGEVRAVWPGPVQVGHLSGLGGASQNEKMIHRPPGDDAGPFAYPGGRLTLVRALPSGWTRYRWWS